MRASPNIDITQMSMIEALLTLLAVDFGTFFRLFNLCAQYRIPIKMVVKEK